MERSLHQHPTPTRTVIFNENQAIQGKKRMKKLNSHLIGLLLFILQAEGTPLISGSIRTDESHRLSSLPAWERTAVGNIVQTFYGKRTAQQLLSAMRVATPTVYHLAFLANERIHQNVEADIQESSHHFDKVMRDASWPVKNSLGQLVQITTQNSRDIDQFTQRAIAENSVQIATNIPLEEALSLRRLLSQHLDIPRASSILSDIRTAAEPFVSRLDELGYDVQRRMEEVISRAKGQAMQMLQLASSSCPRRLQSLPSILSHQLSQILATPPESRAVERNIAALLMAELVVEHAPTLAENMDTANERIARVLQRRLRSLRDLIYTETSHMSADVDSVQERECIVAINRITDEFIDSLEDAKTPFITADSYRRLLDSFGRLSEAQTVKVRKILNDNAALIRPNDILTDAKTSSPTLATRYSKILTAVDNFITEKEGELSQFVQKAVAEQRKERTGRPTEMASAGQAITSQFTAANEHLRKGLRQLLPQLALRILIEQPFDEKDSMKEVFFRWITNDYNNILDEVSRRAPTLYTIVQPFRRLVEEKSHQLTGDAAQLFQETAAESLRKLLYEVSGASAGPESFSVRDSLRALPVSSQRRIASLVASLSPSERAVFAMTSLH